MVYILIENPKVTRRRRPAGFTRSNRRNRSDSALLYKVRARRSSGQRTAEVKPTLAVRAEIDYELGTSRSASWSEKHAAGQAVLPLSALLYGPCAQPTHQGITDKSGIGNYGDKLMEGDYHVGQISVKNVQKNL